MSRVSVIIAFCKLTNSFVFPFLPQLKDEASIRAAEINMAALEVLLTQNTPIEPTLETVENGPRPLTALDPPEPL